MLCETILLKKYIDLRRLVRNVETIPVYIFSLRQRKNEIKSIYTFYLILFVTKTG